MLSKSFSCNPKRYQGNHYQRIHALSAGKTAWTDFPRICGLVRLKSHNLYDAGATHDEVVESGLRGLQHTQQMLSQ